MGTSTASTVLGTATQHLPQEGGLDCLESPRSRPLSSFYLQRASSPLLLQRSGRKLPIRGNCPPYLFPNPVPSPTGPSAPWTEPGSGPAGKARWVRPGPLRPRRPFVPGHQLPAVPSPHAAGADGADLRELGSENLLPPKRESPPEPLPISVLMRRKDLPPPPATRVGTHQPRRFWRLQLKFPSQL